MASTIYEVSKPQQQFYSVERAGFVDVGEAMFSVVTDMVQLGFFQVKSVKFIDISNKPRVINTWPVTERIYDINPSFRGNGYKVGDVLTVEGGTITDAATQPKFQAIVANTYPDTGGIVSINITEMGIYDTVPGPAANLAVSYVPNTTLPREIIFQSTVTNKNGTDFTAIIPMVNGTASNFPSPVPGPGVEQNGWVAAYEANGKGRWPTTGIWFPGDPLTTNALIKVNSELVLIEDSPSGNSYIPPGTLVTSKNLMYYITGITTTGGGYSTIPLKWSENVAKGTRITTSNPVSISEGAKIGFRGTGAKFDNTIFRQPKAWRAILETTAAVDPLSDTVGVFANVAATSTSSTLLQVNSLNTPNAFTPTIYPGQRVLSTLENGSVNGFVTVVSVTKTSTTSANVILSSAQTFSQVNEPLRFVFPDDPQNWRIAIDVRENKTNVNAGPQKVEMYAGTSLQLKDNGEITTIYTEDGATPIDRAGLMGAKPTGAVSLEPYLNELNQIKTVKFLETLSTDTRQGFLNRERRVGSDSTSTSGQAAYPINYLMTMTNRGIFFGLWEGNWSALQKTKSSTDNYFNWFLIQRPVDRNTGQVLTTGVAPVFCINSVGYKYWKMIVREKDVLHPTQGDPNCQSNYVNETTGVLTTETTPYRVPADAHSEDNFAIINSSTQVSLTEDSKYLISLLHDLNTPRFRYTEELDMVGQTSADVCMAGNDLSMSTYNESGPRTYHAMPANNPYNSGLRIVVLKNIS